MTYAPKMKSPEVIAYFLRQQAHCIELIASDVENGVIGVEDGAEILDRVGTAILVEPKSERDNLKRGNAP